MSRVSGVTPPPPHHRLPCFSLAMSGVCFLGIPLQVNLLQHQTLQVGALESGGLSLGSLGLEEPGTITLCVDGTFPGCRGGLCIRRGPMRPDAQWEDDRVSLVRRTASTRLCSHALNNGGVEAGHSCFRVHSSRFRAEHVVVLGECSLSAWMDGQAERHGTY